MAHTRFVCCSTVVLVLCSLGVISAHAQKPEYTFEIGYSPYGSGLKNWDANDDRIARFKLDALDMMKKDCDGALGQARTVADVYDLGKEDLIQVALCFNGVSETEIPPHELMIEQYQLKETWKGRTSLLGDSIIRANLATAVRQLEARCKKEGGKPGSQILNLKDGRPLRADNGMPERRSFKTAKFYRIVLLPCFAE